jgi:hypothetical protein
MLRIRIVSEGIILPGCQSFMIITLAYSDLGNCPIHCIEMIDYDYQLLGGLSVGMTQNEAMT